MDGVQQLISKLITHILKKGYEKTIKNQFMILMVGSQAYNYDDETQVYQIGFKDNDKLAMVSTKTSQPFSFMRYSSNDRQSNSYYNRSNAVSKLEFSSNEAIELTAVHIFSTDEDHKECYTDPVDKCLLSIVQGNKVD